MDEYRSMGRRFCAGFEDDGRRVGLNRVCKPQQRWDAFDTRDLAGVGIKPSNYFWKMMEHEEYGTD